MIIFWNGFSFVITQALEIALASASMAEENDDFSNQIPKTMLLSSLPKTIIAAEASLKPTSTLSLRQLFGGGT